MAEQPSLKHFFYKILGETVALAAGAVGLLGSFVSAYGGNIPFVNAYLRDIPLPLLFNGIAICSISCAFFAVWKKERIVRNDLEKELSEEKERRPRPDLYFESIPSQGLGLGDVVIRNAGEASAIAISLKLERVGNLETLYCEKTVLHPGERGLVFALDTPPALPDSDKAHLTRLACANEPEVTSHTILTYKDPDNRMFITEYEITLHLDGSCVLFTRLQSLLLKPGEIVGAKKGR